MKQAGGMKSSDALKAANEKRKNERSRDIKATGFIGRAPRITEHGSI